MARDRGEEGDVRRRPLHDESVERLGEPCPRLVAVRAVGDQLGDHRVVVHRHLAALEHAGVDAHFAGALRRRAELDEPPGRGQEAARRILGVDPRLDRPAAERDLVLPERQLLAGGDADHQLDEVEAGDHLGHRVLDLEARVHLEEVEAAVGADDELDRAGRAVLHRLGERDRLLAHRVARGLVEERRRRLLEHLLVAALDRALALPEVDDVAVRIAEHLHLDVARLLDELLDEHPVVAERRPRFVLAADEALPGLGVRARDAQALAAAAGARLDHHRVADLLRDLDRVRRVADHVGVAGDRADLGLLGELLGGDLVAHAGDRLDVRADEDDARLLERLARSPRSRRGTRSRDARPRRRSACRRR